MHRRLPGIVAAALLVAACGQPDTPAPTQALAPTEARAPTAAPKPTEAARWREALAAAPVETNGMPIGQYAGLILVPPDEAPLFAGLVVHTANSSPGHQSPRGPLYTIVLVQPAEAPGRPGELVPVYAHLEGTNGGDTYWLAYIDGFAGTCGDYCVGGREQGGFEHFGGLTVNGQRALVGHKPGVEWQVMWKGPEVGQRFRMALGAEAARRVGAGDHSPANVAHARALTELAERFVAVRMD